MQFDPTGGYQGKATVRYKIEDVSDHQVRELSSSSKVLARKMSKFKAGDHISIIATLGDNDRKSYDVVLVGSTKARPTQDEELEEIDELLQDNGNKIPF